MTSCLSVYNPIVSYHNCSLTLIYTHTAVINGLVTTVGGYSPGTTYKSSEATNLLQSLSNRRWTEKFPPMTVDPTLDIDNRKYQMAVAQSDNLLVVIGGTNNSGTLQLQCGQVSMIYQLSAQGDLLQSVETSSTRKTVARYTNAFWMS